MSKCWYCNEELTTGNNPEHLGICDKCYNNMFKAGNDLIGKMTTKIADLEAQLAEKDKTIDEINEGFLSAIKDWKQLVEIEKAEKAQLKQQLAKREKELTKLKSDNHALISNNAYQEADIFEFNSRIEQLQQQLAEKEQTITNLIEDSGASKKFLKKQLAEKDKLIEFYINSGKEQCEEINKLNHRALNYCDVIDKANEDKISFTVEKLEKVKEVCGQVWGMEYEIEAVEDYIDNQIKQLKEMPNEK